MKSKKLLIITLIVGVAIYIGYLTTPKNKSVVPSSTPPASDISALPLEVSKSDKNGWTKIVVPPLAKTTYPVFSISFPSAWTLDNGNNESFTIKKGTSVIGMDRPAVGGGVCLFSDTDLTKLDEYWKGYPIQKTYKEIVVKHGLLRRYKLESPDTNDKNIHYQVCELYTGDKVFEVPLDGGIIGVTTSPNITANDLREIDSILATYQYEK